ENGRVISGAAQLFGDGGLIVGQRRLQDSDARHVRHLARKERLPGRRADRRIAMMARKTSSLRGQPVQVGRRGSFIAIRAEHVARMIVGDYEEEIGLARPLRQRRGRAARKKGAPAEHPLYFISRYGYSTASI